MCKKDLWKHISKFVYNKVLAWNIMENFKNFLLLVAKNHYGKGGIGMFCYTLISKENYTSYAVKKVVVTWHAVKIFSFIQTAF